MQWLLIVVLSILACITYGVLHDQITARISVEYFTVGHVPIVGTNDPTLLGLVWGVLGTWWYGLFLGVPLATFARIGSRPSRSVTSLIRPMFVLLVCTAVLAAISGIIGYFVISIGHISLAPDVAARIPPDKHVSFLVALCIHNTSYTVGFVGGVFLMAWVWWTRIKMDQVADT